MAKPREVTGPAPGAIPGEEVDALYGLPLEQFTKSRNQLAKELRSRGEAEAGDWVGALPKPTAAAWAVNQVMRTQRKDARALLAAGESLRKAHANVSAGKGSAEKLREAGSAEREAVGRLTRAARGLATGRGVGLSETILERVAETLHAVSADSETRSIAEAGRLSQERRASGTEAFAAAPSGRRRTSRDRAGRPSEAQVRKARERLERAERALAHAREEERAAAGRVAERETEVEELSRKLDELR